MAERVSYSPGTARMTVADDIWDRLASVLGDDEGTIVVCPRCDGWLHIRRDETALRGERAERRLRSVTARCSGACGGQWKVAAAFYHWLAMQPPQHPLISAGRKPGTFVT